MLTNHEPDRNIEDLTDTKISAAIHYLEADPGIEGRQVADDHDKDNGAMICVCLYILLAGCLSLLWFYWK